MLSQMCTDIQSWWQQTPLPTSTAMPTFQKWHSFDQDRWKPFIRDKKTSQSGTKHQWAGAFRLVTWNVNANAPLPKSRISALLYVIQTAAPGDVIFLQEVSREVLAALFENPWVQQNWYSSDVDMSGFKTRNFISITLVSKTWIATSGIQFGAIWRVALPSHFKRDALCCDFIFNASAKHSSGSTALRIRLVNVHLDSLAINPSLRRQQLAICTTYLRTAGRGIIAGDFNSVLPGDDELVRANGLVDAWALLHPKDPGYTWGVDGEQAFPPSRLDKVALLNLTPLAMGVLQTRKLGCCGEKVVEGMEPGSKVHFSDHFGLWCEVAWEEDRMREE